MKSWRFAYGNKCSAQSFNIYLWLVVSVIGIVGDVIAQPVQVLASENKQNTSSAKIQTLSEIKFPVTSVKDLLSQSPTNPLVSPPYQGGKQGGVVIITEVKANPTDKGLEVILQTTQGEQLQITNRSAENNFIADIPNAQLRLPSGDAFTFSSPNPVDGISEITITNLDANTIRVTVAGETALPTVELFDSDEGLIFALTSATTAMQPSQQPEGEQPTSETSQETPAAQQDDAPIELVVTGEQDNYRVPDASSATRTDTPIRDIPQSIQVVPRQVFEDRVITNQLDTIRTVSGVSPTTQSNAPLSSTSAISIRGFGSANGLRNGLREVVGRVTDVDLPNLERIEVLKGPASVLYGQGGIGGTINLITKQPLPDPFYQIDFLAGSYDLYRPSIDLSGPLNDSRTVLYRLNASYQSSGRFYDFGKDDRWFVAPVLSWQISPNTDLTLEAQVSRQEVRGIAGLPAVGTVLPNPNGSIPISRFIGEPDDIARNLDIRIGYNLEHRFSKDWSLRSAFRYTSSESIGFSTLPASLDSDNRTLNRSFLAPADNANALNDGFILTTDAVGNFRTGSIQHKLLFGVEYFQQNEEVDVIFRSMTPLDLFNPVYGASRGAVTSGFQSSFSQNTVAVYLQDQIAVADNLKMLLGGRVDVVNQETTTSGNTTELSDTVFTPRVGVVYQPLPPISLYASYSQSFNPVGGSDIAGNAFIPERGTQYEVGIKAELSNQLAATLAFFDLTRSNVLTADPNNPTFSIQTGKQRSRGIELDISGEILPGWNIAAGYAFIDAVITEDNRLPTGNRLNNAPQHTLGLWTSYEIPEGDLRGLGAGLGLFYVGERQGDLANSFSLPGYLRTDASLFYRRNNFRAAVSIKNLFDVEYYEAAFSRLRVFPGEPLTVQGTISWQF